MIKKITLTFSLLVFALLSQVNAQTEISPEKQSAVSELVTLINGDKKAEDLAKAMSSQMESTRAAVIETVLNERTDLSAADKQSLRNSLIERQKQSVQRFQDKLMEKLNYNEMMNEIAAIAYNKYYTLEEIKDLTAFYKTPTGQKSLKMMTPLMIDVMKLTQERLIPKVSIVLEELQDEEKADVEREVNARKPRTNKPGTR